MAALSLLSTLVDLVYTSYFSEPPSLSCPPLEGDGLITTLGKNGSFEGLEVDLECDQDYRPFPRQVRNSRAWRKVAIAAI